MAGSRALGDSPRDLESSCGHHHRVRLHDAHQRRRERGGRILQALRPYSIAVFDVQLDEAALVAKW
jgi:hypothetical protein